MSKVFLSYRRDDSGDVAARLFDRLVSHFGTTKVFKDVDSIPIGADFRERLDAAIRESGVLLAVIGPRWTTLADGNGVRRVDQTTDYVRLEIEAAFDRQIPVIPVLINGAGLPGVADLPETLRQISYQQAAILRPDPDFHLDAKRLIAAIQKHGVKSRIRQIRTSLFVTALVVAALVGALFASLPNTIDPRAIATDSLIDLITSTVEPTCWDTVGGPASIEGLDGILTISATLEQHYEIQDLLSRTRTARGIRPKPEHKGLGPEGRTTSIFSSGLTATET